MRLRSRELKDFFIGNLLGDGCIHNGSFTTKSINKDLLFFKAKVIKDNLPNIKYKIIEHKESVDKNGVRRKRYWELYVSPNEYLKKLEREFYPNGVKIIPDKYIRDLSLLGYAIWYADDGTTILVGYNEITGSAKYRRVQFCTDHFSYEEVIKLSKMVEKQFGDLSIIKRKDEEFRIQLKTYNAQNFLISIAPYFLKYFKSLLYKLDMGYRGESLYNRKYVQEEYHNLFVEISAYEEFIDRVKVNKLGMI